MKRILAILAVVVAVAVVASTVEAGQCPLLIKQLKEAKVADAAKKAQVDKLVAEAQKLHDEGKHAESVQKCEEAAKVAGITLKKKS